MSPMYRRLAARLTLVAASILLVTSCSSDTDDAADSSATRVVETTQGQVSVPVQPKRVVVLNYALAGYLYDLDIPVTSVTNEDSSRPSTAAAAWRDKAEADNTEFMTWGPDGFSIEAILAQEPDLIIGGGWGLPGVLATKVYDQLSEIAPTVIVDKKLPTWKEQFRFLAADVFGQEDRYQGYLDDYDDRVAEVKENITVPPTPVTYLNIAADGRPFVLLENSALPQTLSAVGLTPAPVAAEHGLQPYQPGQDAARLSPEVLGDIVSSPTVFVMGFNADTTSVEELASSPVYARLPAFRESRAYDLPYWTHRADYDETLAMLDIVEKQFS
ncbi:ABC transporter substrate-binding protein [Gordonia sp. CPCC 206044]|uniref:ABC transporter substrate-binding protein n=1 Tax=Gordonia sp. CPCC 206044 TaxID=3140793 RepID=UPI003AF3398F